MQLVGDALSASRTSSANGAFGRQDRHDNTGMTLVRAHTMEVEILKEALDVARVKKPSLQLPSWNDRKDGSP